MCGSPHNIIVKMGQHFSKKSIKKDCPLGDNEKKLQNPCVTFTLEEWIDPLRKWVKHKLKKCVAVHTIRKYSSGVST